MPKRTSSPKLFSLVDYSLFHSNNLNWIKGVVATALCVHGLALRLMVEFVSPSGLLYFLVHGGLAVGALVSMILLVPPLTQEISDNWREKTVSPESGLLMAVGILFVVSVWSSFLFLPWIYYEIIPFALTIHAIGRYWIWQKKQKVEMALPIQFNRIERCNRVEIDGSVLRIPLVDLKVGDEIKITPSQVIPVDGVIVNGEGYVSEASLDGSTFPRIRQPGDPILAGSVSLDGVFTLKSLSSYVARKIQSIDNPLLSEINPQTTRAKGAYAVPIAIGILVSLAFVGGFISQGIYAALVRVACVLIISTSLDWVTGVPVHYWTGLVHLAKRRLYGRHPQFVEDLASTDHAFFGKTGVIAGTELKLQSFFVMPAFQDREDWIMSMVYQTSRMVHHPLVNPLMDVGELIEGQPVVEDLKYRVIPGMGVEVTLTDGLGHLRKLLIGESGFILGRHGEARLQSILEEHDLGDGQRIWVSLDDRLCAIAKLKDSWNIAPQPFFSSLESLGIRTGILTGDTHFEDSRLEGLACEKGLSAMDKQRRVENAKRDGAHVLFVGDGLNDYRALMAADTSIVMRHAPEPLLASSAAILASDKLPTIIYAISFCRRLVRLSKRNQWYFSAAVLAVGFGVSLGWLNTISAIGFICGANILIWFQSFLMGSSSFSKVEDTDKRNAGSKEGRRYLARNQKS